MSIRETLVVFSERFITKSYRERFVHEAMKKPRKLHSRVCHELPSLLSHNDEKGFSNFQPSDECLFLGWSGAFLAMTWADALERMSGGGGGYLVISSLGDKFHAESEGYPSRIYAAHS